MVAKMCAYNTRIVVMMESVFAINVVLTMCFVGVAHSLGRKEYGRLGLGESNLEEKSKPTVIPLLRSKKCIHVSCGSAVSYAVTKDGGCLYCLLVST